MASSSTSSIQNKSFKYNVFLSFRGEDLRKTFIDHLYEALKQQGIYTYKDDEKIQKGRRIKEDLFESIQESKFFIIVFSKNYASSAWCLNELVNIMECHNTTHQTAFPVFYHVDPTEVRHQSGAFGEAFAKHNNKKEAVKWREALEEAGNLAGWVLENTADGHEAKFIKEIVGLLSLELRSINLYIDKKLVGMKPRMTKVLSSIETGIENVGIIGIKGIGGGGKTTLAKAVFDKISTQFEGKSFVENVSKVTREAGLQSLQEQILSDVLKTDQSIIVRSVHNGKSLMKNMLWGRKVLIVLDNVDNICQLEALVGDRNWFKAGSRIIITTRDEQVLTTHEVRPIHDVDLLSVEEAICLFSRYAFGRETPPRRYRMLSTQVVRYAAGLPLMIKVLGALLCGKKEDEWADQLESLKKRPLQEPMDILKLSYINLEGYLQEIFLDVACFLKSWHKDDVVRILESCGFNAKIGLKLLEEKSLITISDDQYLGMHDLIQEMGRDIVRHPHHDDPERHSRLWILDEIEDILANDLGTDKTRAIAVNDSLELSSEIVTKGFRNMNKIRFLRVVSKTEDNYSCWDEKIDQVSQTLPYSLRYLSWRFYPHSSLPTTFQANNLVALEMSDCRIHQLWEGKKVKVLSKLRFLVLSFSKLRTLDLGLTPYLETLDLEGCRDLEVLHTPIGCLKRLIFLNLNGCLKINSFVFIKQLESLKVLSLSRLYLKEFPDIIPGDCTSSLVELQFRHNDIQELPSSIANLQKLVYLDLHYCRQLRSLPGSICGLRHLRNLKLYGCMLEELPEEIGHLVCLEKLNMSNTSIRHLPDSICMLKHLKTLKLSFCRNLEELPGDLGRLECLEKLVLTECTQVKDIPDSICRLKHLKYLSLLDCIQLEKLPKELGFSGCLEVLNVKGTRIRQLPPSISPLQGLKLIQAKSVLQSRGYAGNIKSLLLNQNTNN